MRLQTLKQSFPMKFCLLFIRLNLSKLNQINIRWILITFELFELTPGKSLRNWSISPLPAFCDPNVRLFDIFFLRAQENLRNGEMCSRRRPETDWKPPTKHAFFFSGVSDRMHMGILRRKTRFFLELTYVLFRKWAVLSWNQLDH